MNITQPVESETTSIFEEGLIPLQFHTFQAIVYPIAHIICVPMNLFVAYVIIADRRLHNARNATWLGVITSNLMVLFMMAIMYFVFIGHSYTACQILSFLYGTPYAILLINILLATCDRIIYTKWPLFHQSHVTVPRIVAVQLVCSMGAFVGLSSHYLSGSKRIRCGCDPQYAKPTMGTISVLIILCIAAKLIVYFMAMNSKISRQRGVVVTRVKVIEQSSKMIVREVSEPRLQLHCATKKFRREELNATITLVTNLIPLILFASLSYLYMLVQLLCHNLYESCETINRLEIVFREVAALHVCTNLLVYIFRSLEFRSAVYKLFPQMGKP